MIKGPIFIIYRPNIGRLKAPVSERELNLKYRMTTPVKVNNDVSKQAKSEWEKEYERSEKKCIHDCECKLKDKCVIGRRCRTIYIIVNNLIEIWKTLEERILSHSEKNEKFLKIIRVSEKDKDGVIGIKIPDYAVSNFINIQ